MVQVIGSGGVWGRCWGLSFSLDGSRQQEGLEEEKGHVASGQMRPAVSQSPRVPSPPELWGEGQRGRLRDSLRRQAGIGALGVWLWETMA